MPLGLRPEDTTRPFLLEFAKSIDLTRAEREAIVGEALFVRTRGPQHYARLQILTKEVLCLRTSLTQKKLLAQSQRISERGRGRGDCTPGSLGNKQEV